MAFEGGYTSAVNDQAKRQSEKTRDDVLVQDLILRQWQEQQKEQQAQQEKAAGAKAFALQSQLSPQGPGAPQGGPQPQPMGPGQASVPMMPPPPQGPPPAMAAAFGPKPGMAPPGPPPPMGMQLPGMGGGGPPPGPPGGAPAPAMPPPGWKPSPAAPPSLGGQPPPGQGPAGGGAGGQIAAPPMSPMTDEPILPPKLRTAEAAIESIKNDPSIPENMRYPVLLKMSAIMDKQNKEKIEQWNIDQESRKAGMEAAKEKRLAMEAKLKAQEHTPEIKNALFATGGNEAEARKLVADEERHKGRTTIHVAGGGEGVGKAPSGYRWSKENKGELEAIPGGPADPAVAAAKKNAIQLTGGRESVYTTRVMQAANQASKDLANIVKLPVAATTTGMFGGRHQGTSLFEAGKEVLAQKMTSQEAQTYNVMATGLQRSLAAVETSGLAQGIQEFSKQIDVVAKEGDTQLTKLHKLAQVRQIIEAGLEPVAANPRVSPDEKKLVQKALDNVHASVPFTHSDLIQLVADQEGNPKKTLNSIIGKGGVVKPGGGGSSDILKQADAIIGK
jgi:hypothetical protein